ncbi:MAG: preprotein translocase subunit SecE [Proteobacteria bacterium]|jgi:preprotein translocase subunit SecE|nr:preprotein translocase subunit SecE [Pseudomonadota bacterium]MDA0996142.1 preprotein translocase subunit SecE [Pseudomonadota bacterium]
MNNPLNFFRSVKQEIFKITWPTSKEALMGSVMVIVMAVIASLFFLLLDQVFKIGLNFLIGA